MAIHELVWQMDLAADAILVEALGVNFQSARVLMILQSDQPMTQRGLAACLGQTPAAISRSLPSFVQSGWIDVRVDPKQPRRNFLTLTEAGEKLAKACWQQLEDAFGELLAQANVDGEALLGQITLLNQLLAKNVFGENK